MKRFILVAAFVVALVPGMSAAEAQGVTEKCLGGPTHPECICPLNLSWRMAACDHAPPVPLVP